MICVPGTAKLPATSTARVMVLKLQAAVGVVPAMPLPVAVVSLPFAGSTKYLLPVAGAQPVQVLFTQVLPLPQSAFVQQLPATQSPLQQKSAALAAQAPLELHEAPTQVPAPMPGAVWQMVDGP